MNLLRYSAWFKKSFDGLAYCSENLDSWRHEYFITLSLSIHLFTAQQCVENIKKEFSFSGNLNSQTKLRNTEWNRGFIFLI